MSIGSCRGCFLRDGLRTSGCYLASSLARSSGGRMGVPDEGKRTEALTELRAIRAQGRKIKRRGLRSLTGRLEWRAGMLPQLDPSLNCAGPHLQAKEQDPFMCGSCKCASPFRGSRLSSLWVRGSLPAVSGRTQPTQSQSLHLTPPLRVAAPSGAPSRPCTSVGGERPGRLPLQHMPGGSNSRGTR